MKAISLKKGIFRGVKKNAKSVAKSVVNRVKAFGVREYRRYRRDGAAAMSLAHQAANYVRSRVPAIGKPRFASTVRAKKGNMKSSPVKGGPHFISRNNIKKGGWRQRYLRFKFL